MDFTQRLYITDPKFLKKINYIAWLAEFLKSCHIPLDNGNFPLFGKIAYSSKDCFSMTEIEIVHICMTVATLLQCNSSLFAEKSIPLVPVAKSNIPF